jgi:hypothetical protein
MTAKELIEALEGLDPEKEIRVTSTYDNYKIVGVYIADDRVDIELERTT